MFATLLMIFLELVSAPTAEAGFVTFMQTSATTTTTMGTSSPPDLSSSFVAWWDCDESTNNVTRANHTGASCGTACDLSNNGSVWARSFEPLEGSYACSFSGNASSDYLSCTDGTCGGTASNRLDMPASGVAFTYMCWLRATGFGSSEHKRVFYKRAASGGYEMQYRNTGTGTIRCRTNGTGTNGNVDATANAVPHDGTWQHVACSYNNVGKHLQPWVNGQQSGAGQSNVAIGDVGADFGVSHTAQEWEGELDECGVIKRALVESEVCHIISCGIDGPNGPCLCNADGSYADTGRHLGGSAAFSWVTCTLGANTCLNPLP